jgi:multidrug efflux pump subunit AcrB
MGMTAFMGIISLIGIVVRNGIILVDYADHLVRDQGYSIKAAAVAAGKRRMRPIFLTSAAAAVGVVPMIIGKSPLWAPLGSVLALGLIVSMIFTLFVVPVLYYLFIKPVPEINLEKDAVITTSLIPDIY